MTFDQWIKEIAKGLSPQSDEGLKFLARLCDIGEDPEEEEFSISKKN